MAETYPSQPRVSLTDVEATAVQVALYRHRGASTLLRPDGLPYYDPSYDETLVNACLAPAEQRRILEQHANMVGVVAVRTAEVDEHLMRALQGSPRPGGSDAGGGGAPSTDGAAIGSGADTGGGGGMAAAEHFAAGVNARGGVRQVVLVGAGLDPRAWRLPLPPSSTRAALKGATMASQSAANGGGAPSPSTEAPTADAAAAADATAAPTADAESRDAGVTVYELDSGSVEGLKTEVLGQPAAGGCRRVFVRVDLSRPEQALAALAAAGHDAARPSVFIAEGLIGYLTVDAGNSLLRRLRSIASPGSLLLLTVPPSPAWRDELAARGVQLHHATFEEPEETLARVLAAAWDARLLSAESLGRKYRLLARPDSDTAAPAPVTLQALVVGSVAG